MDSTGLFSDRPFSVWTGSPLIDALFTGYSSIPLYDAVIFLHNVSIGGPLSRLVMTNCSIDARWQVPTSWSAPVYLSAILHTGGMSLAGKGHMAMENCKVHVEGPQRVYGIYHRWSTVTIANGSQYLMSETNWVIRGSVNVYGIYHSSSSSLTITNGSQYLMREVNLVISGSGSNVFGIYHLSSALTIANGSQYLMREVNWTTSGSSTVYGIYHGSSYSFTITNGSQYLIREVNWMISGRTSAYGIRFMTDSPFIISDGSHYVMSHCRWLNEGPSGMTWLEWSNATLTDTYPAFPSSTIFASNSFLSPASTSTFSESSTVVPLLYCNTNGSTNNHRLGFNSSRLISCLDNEYCAHAADCVPSYLSSSVARGNQTHECQCSCNTTAQALYAATVLAGTVWSTMDHIPWHEKSCWLKFPDAPYFSLDPLFNDSPVHAAATATWSQSSSWRTESNSFTLTDAETATSVFEASRTAVTTPSSFEVSSLAHDASRSATLSCRPPISTTLRTVDLDAA